MTLEFEYVLDLSPSFREGEKGPLAYAFADRLSDFVGECTVIGMESSVGGDITRDDLIESFKTIEDEQKKLRDLYGDDSFRSTRFLFRTRASEGEEGRYFSTDAIGYLTEAGVKLVGIDMPGLSATPYSGNVGFSYLVNLCLDELEPGSQYRLLSPPLPGASPAPVRPVLVT